MTTATDPRYTQAAYDTARKSWQDHIEMFGLSHYNKRSLRAAYGLWVANGPQFAHGDN